MAHMNYKGITLNTQSNDTLNINLDSCHVFLKINHLEDGFIHLASVEIQKKKRFEYDRDKRSVEMFLHSGDSFHITFINELIVVSIRDATTCKDINLLTIDIKYKKIMYYTNEEEDF